MRTAARMPLAEACALLAVELPRPASPEVLEAWKAADLVAAYRAAVRANHPDLGKSDEEREARTEKMKRINAAREQLAAVRVRAPTAYGYSTTIDFSSIFRTTTPGFRPPPPARPDTYNTWEARQGPTFRAVCARCQTPYNPQAGLHVCEAWKRCDRCGMQWRGSHECRKAPDENIETAMGADLDRLGARVGVVRQSAVRFGALDHESDNDYRRRIKQKRRASADVDTATRTDLDAIGNPIGCPRERNEKDAAYRVRLHAARVSALLGSATGKELDDIGAKMGCPRLGLAESDGAYRERMMRFRRAP